MTAKYDTPEEAKKQAKKRANTEGRPVHVFRVGADWYVYTVDETMPAGSPEEMEEIFPDRPSTEGGGFV